MSRPYRNRTRYRQHPYKHWTESSAVKQERVFEDKNFPSSPYPTSAPDNGGKSQLPGWDYLLRRKAESINDRILKSKASESYGGTSYSGAYEVSSQFVIKQEPGNPTVREQYSYSALSWTTCNDRAHDYAQKGKFWIERTAERNILEPEAGQSRSDRLTDAYENHQTRKVKFEHPLGFRESRHSNYSATSSGQGSHLTVEKLISNIRRAVASNPNFKRNVVDSVCSQTSGNGKKQSSISDKSVETCTTSSELRNPVTQGSEETLTCNLPQNTGDEVKHGTMMDNDEEVEHGSMLNKTSDVANGRRKINHVSKPDMRRNKHNPEGGKTLIHTLPYPAEGVEVQYTKDPVEAEAWLKNNVIDCSAQAVGLDIEWKPQLKRKKDGGVENKTAVLQLSVEGSCLVLHLCHMESKPVLLRNVLSNKLILKVGSGILQDVTKLNRDTGLSCKGLMDTQKMAKSIGIPVSQKLGLKALAKHFLGIDLEKPKSVSMSNWERCPLRLKQIHYAALDAWIGLKIYLHMKMVKGQEQVFMEEDDEEKHVETLQCQVCGKKVKGQDSLNKHSTIHPQCKCGQIFLSEISKKHKKKCPFGRALVQEVQTDDDVTVWCQGCGKKCKNEEVFKRHVREVGHVQCPFCNRLLQNSQSIKHIQRCKNIN